MKGLVLPEILPDTIQLMNTQHSNTRICVSRLYYSMCGRVTYLILTSLCLVGLTWSIMNLGRFPRDPVFISIEIFIVCAAFFDISLRYYLKNDFLRKWQNYLDICVVLLSLLFLLIALTWDKFEDDVKGILGQVLMITRNFVMLVRAIVFLKGSHKIHEIQLSEIDITTIIEDIELSNIN